MKAKEYSGWYNYNVWNVMLYIGNESDLYDFEQQFFREYYLKKIKFSTFKQRMNQLGRMAHQRSDIKNEKLTKKEILEIRKGINRDYKEQKGYWDEHGV